MRSPHFGSVLTAMVTPFTDSGAVDIEASVTLAKYLTLNGSDGLVIAGSTGEGTSLSDDEKCSLVEAVAQAVTVPVVAGMTSSDTATSVRLTSLAQGLGAAGILATTPAYVRPSQRGIAAHLGAVANSTSLPVMLYDIPIRTGRKISPATTISLATEHRNVVALKDASAELVAAATVLATLGSGFDLYSGDDGLTLPFIAIGACGVVSVCSHWAGPEVSAMVAAAHQGDWNDARRLNQRLLRSYAFESSELYPNPVPAKAAMRALGFAVGQCRLPLGDADELIDDAAVSLVAELVRDRG